MRYRNVLAATVVALTVGSGVALVTSSGSSETESARTAVESATTVAASDTESSDDGGEGTDSERSGQPGNGASSPSTGIQSSEGAAGAPPETENPLVPGVDEPLPDDGPTHPLGEVIPGGPVPAGLGFASFPGSPPEPSTNPAVSGPDSFSAGPGCANQCISSGWAYPRGFGAELVVTTTVPADIFLSVVADTTGDGKYDFSQFAWSPPEVTEFSWALDHLDPGQRYYAMAAATDEHDGTSHGFGEFTTLSKRTVKVKVNSVQTDDGKPVASALLRAAGADYGVPDYVNGNSWYDVPWYDLGTWREFANVGRDIPIDLLVRRPAGGGSICEATWPNHSTPYGYYHSGCLAWNTASAIVDLDQVPSGKTRWTTHSFAATLNTQTGSGSGQSLPNGYGEPHYFDAMAPITVHVTYSD